MQFSAFNLENFTPDRFFLHGHRLCCPLQIWGMGGWVVQSPERPGQMRPSTSCHLPQPGIWYCLPASHIHPETETFSPSRILFWYFQPNWIDIVCFLNMLPLSPLTLSRIFFVTFWYFSPILHNLIVSHAPSQQKLSKPGPVYTIDPYAFNVHSLNIVPDINIIHWILFSPVDMRCLGGLNGELAEI